MFYYTVGEGLLWKTVANPSHREAREEHREAREENTRFNSWGRLIAYTRERSSELRTFHIYSPVKSNNKVVRNNKFQLLKENLKKSFCISRCFEFGLCNFLFNRFVYRNFAVLRGTKAKK